jgi:hypothetical protein
VRVLVSVDEKQLLDDATSVAGGELAGWIRPLILDAAKKMLAEEAQRKAKRK